MRIGKSRGRDPRSSWHVRFVTVCPATFGLRKRPAGDEGSRSTSMRRIRFGRADIRQIARRQQMPPRAAGETGRNRRGRPSGE
jgi:hypothetical protein